MSQKRHHWYKRFSADALNGKIGLNLEQKGLYDTLIDLCYDRRGPVPDDTDDAERELAHLAGCSRRLFRVVRDQLIAKEKVFRMPDGRLMVRGFRLNSDSFRAPFEPGSAGFRVSNPDRKERENTPNGTPIQDKTMSSPNSGGHEDATQRLESRKLESNRRVDFVKRLLEAIGTPYDPQEHGNWGHILLKMLEENRLDFDKHVLPAVKGRVARGLRIKPKTPLFFLDNAIEVAQMTGADKTKVSATTSPPPEPMTGRQWDKALKRFLEVGIWVSPGPSPLFLACSAPPALLEPMRAQWLAQGNHPVYADRDCNFPWAPMAGSRGMGSSLFPEAIPVEAKGSK